MLVGTQTEMEQYLDFDNLPPVGRKWHEEHEVADLIEEGRRRLSRRGLMGVALAAPFSIFLPRAAEAATNFLYEGAGSFGVGVANVLTTELNSLANSSANVLSTLGAALQNTNARLYADFEYVAGGTSSPVTGAFIEVWQLLSVDGGTNYEDGSATVAPGRAADFTIKIRAGTSITPRAGSSKVPMPPAFWKGIARNQTGVTLAASSNLIRYALYTVQF